MTIFQQPKKTYYAKAPGKLILFGEHSVLYGSKCITIAIKKYGKVYTIPGAGKILCKDSLGNLVTLNEILDLRFVNIDVIIELGMPMGSGLGTSALVSLFTSAIISINDNEPPFLKEKIVENESTIRRRAIHLENAFHGRSSGIDVISCYFGGIICYHDKLISRIEQSGITDYKIMIWHSKIQKKTSDALKPRCFAHQKLAQVAEEASEMLSGKFTLIEFYNLVRRAQDALEELGIIPDAIKKEVRRLRCLGIEAKVSGSGNGGHLVTLIRKEENILGWEEVEVDYEGFSFV